MNNSSANYIVLNRIGIIQTPYIKKAPFQPLPKDDGEFLLILDKEYAKGLHLLDSFTYSYVIYYLDKVMRSKELLISPPWANKQQVGVFASRSPNRPNPIGISVVKIKKIVDNIVYISGIDAFNGTPILDIKPYLNKLDAKPDANYGWVADTEDTAHLDLHIKGIAHSH